MNISQCDNIVLADDVGDSVRKLKVLSSSKSLSDSLMMSDSISEPHLGLCSPPLTVSTRSHLQSLYGHCPPGTVVFLQPEQTLVFKVDKGWRHIVVS